MALDLIHILLADDDKDDCLLFREVLDELNIATQLTLVFDGQQLMQRILDTTQQLPDVIFLDLNMPRKNGFECLIEIKQHEKLLHLPVIIFSTSFEKDIVSQLYKNGARHYIRKPNSFSQLSAVIQQALHVLPGTPKVQPAPEKFVLSNDAQPPASGTNNNTKSNEKQA